MTAAMRVGHYNWAGGREAMLRVGPDRGPLVVVAMPLLEEANRTRAVVATMLRRLGDQGIAGALPDLPGQGESLVATGDARLADWRAAFAAAAAALPGPAHVAAIRGGCLVDHEAGAASRWHLSPIDGAAQGREWRRARSMAEEATDLFAGNDLAPDLVAAIEDAEPVATGRRRVVRLAGDPRPAATVLPGPPPWRAAEPRRDDALARLLADDLVGWIATCGGC